MTDEKIIDLFFERSEQAIPAPGRPFRAPHWAVPPPFSPENFTNRL